MVGSEEITLTEDLIPHSEMVQFFTKGKNRPRFAALLVAHLIDKDTRPKSNVHDKGGKEKLDPKIIQLIVNICCLECGLH